MKKIFRFMMAALAATAAMTACQQENLEPDVQEQETVEVKVTIGEQTKGFTDLEGITWEVGDQIKYAGGVELTSEPLKAEKISADGYTASFTFAASLNEVDRTGWFVSTKCHPGNYDQVEFTLGNGSGNIYTQEVAGEMNSRYLFLHSGTGLVQIKAGETPEISMDVVGTIFRVIPYTTTYNDESVLSVKLESETDLVGTVAYDRGGGTYKGVNDINFQKFKNVKVNLGTPFSLDGVLSAEDSKGIYLAVAATTAAVPLDGYQYIVETDKATYTFDAMDKTLVVDENVVKNVKLNLDNAVRLSEGGQLRYTGDLNNASKAPLSAYGINDFDGGYWYAQILQDGTLEWVNKDGNDNLHFYSGVEFTVTDPETGDPVDWLTVRYGGPGGSHWLLSLDENAGAERSAVITATFPDVKGYVVVDECKTKSIIVTQAAAGGPRAVTYGSTSLPANITLEGTASTDKDAGYCLLLVDGVEYRDWAGIYSDVTFKCVTEEDAAAGNYENEVDWLSCRYATNASGVYDCIWWVSAQANEGAESRTAVIVALFPDDDEYSFPEPKKLIVTQSAAPAGGDAEGGDDDVVVEGMSYTIFNNAADGSNGTGFGPVAGSVGDWYRFESITINGKTYTPGDEIKNLANNTELMAELMAKAFEFGEITESDVQIPGTDPLTTDPESFVTLEPWSDGGAAIYVRIVLTANDSGARRTFKIITKDGEGNKVSSVVYFQNS